jgi:phenylalanyl-tRNA synthetase beta chain
LLRIGAKIENIDESSFEAVAPFERNDLNIEEDYIEEIGRIYGLSKIESVIPEMIPLKEINVRHYYSDQVRQALMNIGFSEVITSSFQKKGDLQLHNSLASDKSFLRNSLIKNITSVLDSNYSHTDLLGMNDVRVFEIGTVFEKNETGVDEKILLTLGVRTKGNGYNPKDDKMLDTALIAANNVLGNDIKWTKDKGVAELDLSSVLDNLPVPKAYEPVVEKPAATYTPVSPFPAISRDIALWVKEDELSDTVIDTLVKAAGDICVRHTLFDTFTKDGKTSYAFRLVFQSDNRTLTDNEVNEIMDQLNKIAASLGWEVR